jgi:hypothetical protein
MESAPNTDSHKDHPYGLHLGNSYEIFLGKDGLLLLITVVCAYTGQRGGEKERTTMQNEKLIGDWKFISMKARTAKGEVIYPYGEDGYGMLIYTSTGHMSALLMRRNRPKFVSGDPFTGTPEEIKAAFEGFDAYCGTYEVDAENGTVTHHVEASRLPDWVGTDQVRQFRFSDDKLTITASFPVKGELWDLEGVLVRL